jgi:hypothetical protein
MNIEQISIYVVSAVLFFYALHASTVFEFHYPEKLVEMYAYPWWRILLLVLIAIGYWWCPTVGVLLAIVVFFYLHDMYVLTSRKLN